MIDDLRRAHPDVPDAVLRKAALLFRGVRFSDALAGAARDGAAPNFWPHRPPGGEPVAVPYLFALPDGGVARVRVDDASPYEVRRADGVGGFAVFEGERRALDVGFVPRHAWHARVASDGALGATAGVEQLGDMIVVNVAPGCEYFRVETPDGRSARCTFCAYGRFDRRSRDLGQTPGRTDVDDAVIERLARVVALAAPESRHVYLTGGSLTDPAEEARRFLPVIAAVRAAAPRARVTCGSGAVPPDWARRYRDAGADAVCWNLEVWDEEAFRACCPGKQMAVGRERWIEWLVEAARVFGRGRVASAFVAGLDLRPPAPPRSPERMIESALAGARFLADHGIVALFSPLWPVPGTEYGGADGLPLDLYLRLEAALAEERARRGFPVPDWLTCRRCSYMLTEVDFDHARGIT